MSSGPAKKAPRRAAVDRELEALASALSAASPPEASVITALRSKHALVCARAAQAVREMRWAAGADELLAAYARMAVDGAKHDPGCFGKLAVLEALDHLEHVDPEPFEAATRYVQLEKRWGPREDTATGVRVRGLFALTRLRFTDLLLVAGRLLADREPPVRHAAATALAEHGDRDGAALLLLRLEQETSEPDPATLAECIRALFVLAPDHGATTAMRYLRDAELRELTAHAIAAARQDSGIELLAAELAASIRADERAPIIAALGASRHQRAREIVLGLVGAAPRADALAAIAALAVHSYDPSLAREVRAIAATNSAADLGAAIAEAFPSVRE
jgi:hypothetical protein